MNNSGLLTVGWREWLALPALGVSALKAKVDTGARSSALHVDELDISERRGVTTARFIVRPGRDHDAIRVETEVIGIRPVTDSGGRTTQRAFIRTELELGGHRWPIEMNLTNRTNMLFPMLLGRTAMAGRLIVDPSQSYLLGQPRNAQ